MLIPTVISLSSRGKPALVFFTVSFSFPFLSLKPLVPSQDALQAPLLWRACPERRHSILCVLVLCSGNCNFLVSPCILAKKTGSK